MRLSKAAAHVCKAQRREDDEKIKIRTGNPNLKPNGMEMKVLQ